jgi:hypothetical protein
MNSSHRAWLPKTWRDVADQGTVFRNMAVSSSRAIRACLSYLLLEGTPRTVRTRMHGLSAIFHSQQNPMRCRRPGYRVPQHGGEHVVCAELSLACHTSYFTMPRGRRMHNSCMKPSHGPTRKYITAHMHVLLKLLSCPGLASMAPGCCPSRPCAPSNPRAATRCRLCVKVFMAPGHQITNLAHTLAHLQTLLNDAGYACRSHGAVLPLKLRTPTTAACQGCRL